MTANGKVQTREEGTVYVKELDIFVTVMLLEDTPAVLFLGKLCEDHGKTYHWTSGQKPHLTQNGKNIFCIIWNYVPFGVPVLSTNSSTSSSRTSSTSYQTMYHLWFLGPQRVLPQLRLHLLRHHLHHRILYLTSTDTPKIQ